MKLTTFIKEGIWLKGNLHTHTTNSDGELPPERVVHEYRERGYQFLCLSDHDIFTAYPQFNEEGRFVMIPGFEASLRNEKTPEKGMHVNVFCRNGDYDFAQDETFEIRTSQESMEFLKKHAKSNILVLNHPYWNALEWEEIIDLPGITCMEIYNHASEWLDLLGNDVREWDALLRKGRKLWGLATDDSHNGYVHRDGWPFHLIENDSFGGFIVVKAKAFTHEAIIEAIDTGSFYSSMGPEIHDFYVENGEAMIKCSPCERICLMGNRGKVMRALGVDLMEARIPLKGQETYVRVACVDKYGKIAYSNPIFL